MPLVTVVIFIVAVMPLWYAVVCCPPMQCLSTPNKPHSSFFIGYTDMFNKADVDLHDNYYNAL